VPLSECRKCFLVFRRDRPSSETLGTLYQDGYYGHWEEYGSWDSVWTIKTKTFNEYLAMVLPHVARAGGRPRRLLDVGCAHGYMLVAGQRMGFESHGVEVSAEAVAAAQERGLLVQQGTIERIFFPQAHFDVITAIDVIEHLPQPRDFMEQLQRLLRPGGALLLVTPDVGSMAAQVARTHWPHYKPEHVCYYSKRSIARLLSMAGFELISVQPAFKYLTYDYIRGHFQKYSRPVLSMPVVTVGNLLSKALRGHPLRLRTEMMVIGRVADEGSFNESSGA